MSLQQKGKLAFTFAVASGAVLLICEARAHADAPAVSQAAEPPAEQSLIGATSRPRDPWTFFLTLKWLLV